MKLIYIKEKIKKQPIIYRAGLVTDNKEAKEWFDFLKSKEAKEILKEYHFEG